MPRYLLGIAPPVLGCSVVVCLGLLLTACGSNAPLTSASPVAPTPLAPTAPVGPVVPNVTLSGVVTENGRPIESAYVEVQWSCGGGCSAGTGGVTDAAGRYVIARLPDGASVWVTAHKDGFVQQCAATTVMRAGVSLDLRLTSIASLSTAQPVSGAGLRAVSGTVFESTPAGRRPVADAAVSAYSESLYYAEAVAYTRSDTAGRYWLCGLSVGRIPYLVAEREGFNVSTVSVEPGTDTTFDIQLHR